MHAARLSTRQEITLDIWDNEQLHSHVSSRCAPTETLGDGFPRFADFEFLGPETVSRWHEGQQHIRMRGKSTGEKQYSDETALSPLEVQADRSLRNEQYDRSIVALHGTDVIGVIPCHWRKTGTGGFWRYARQYVDVRKDSKHRGVATAMLRMLDQAEFLEGKILQTGMYWTEEGRDHLRKASERELKGEKYALIPDDYWSAVPPAAFGVYDHRGKRVR